jgi:hypothetical protein
MIPYNYVSLRIVMTYSIVVILVMIMEFAKNARRVIISLYLIKNVRKSKIALTHILEFVKDANITII